MRLGGVSGSERGLSPNTPICPIGGRLLGVYYYYRKLLARSEIAQKSLKTFHPFFDCDSRKKNAEQLRFELRSHYYPKAFFRELLYYIVLSFL